MTGARAPSLRRDLAELTAAEAAELIRSRDLTALELVDACLDRIVGRDAAVRAWAHCDPVATRAAAAELDRATPGSALHGIPIGIKDVIDTSDMPTEHNSPLYRGNRPQRDADCVAMLRQAGAVILGKTATVEFAAGGRKAETRNPLDLTRTPGGSSSGSAAAVADRHVPIALGTQSAGSVIRPASYCGICAIKPSWGVVSRAGIKLYAASLDTLGWMARSVADLRLVADAFGIERAAPRDGVAGLRIAVCRTPSWPLAEPSTARALTDGAKGLRAAGVEISELELPDEFAGLVGARRLIAVAEGGAAFLADYRLHGEKLHPAVRALVENRSKITSAELRSAYDLAARCRARFDDIASGFDAVLTPSAAGEAPLGLASTGGPEFNETWTLLHVPCINLPGFTGDNGMPVGLTLTGPRFSDGALLALAEPISHAFPRSATERSQDA